VTSITDTDQKCVCVVLGEWLWYNEQSILYVSTPGGSHLPCASPPPRQDRLAGDFTIRGYNI